MEGFDQKTAQDVARIQVHILCLEQYPQDRLIASLSISLPWWPDDAHLWERIARYLRTLPFNLITPDLLGYAGTDKPTDLAAYKFDVVSNDLKEICAAEIVTKVIIIGHDWGAAVASRFYNYHPSLVAGMTLLNVACLLPSKDKVDLAAFNAFITPIFGYPIYQYWNFFSSPAAPKILHENVERLYSTLHAEGENTMSDLFHKPRCHAELPDQLLDPGTAGPALRTGPSV
jgi:soluble epoxide hydrolase/lipid-phosphate phosphatase